MTNSDNIAQYSIKLQGRILPDTFQLIAFNVAKGKQENTAALEFYPQQQPDSGNINTYASDFSIGQALEISAGYDAQLAPIFNGHVSQHTFRASASAQQVIVSCKGPALSPAPPHKADSMPRMTYGENILEVELKKSSATITGQLSVQGGHLYTPGASLLLDGMGKPYNGTYRMTAVEHTFTDGNWISTLHIESIQA